MPVTPRAVGHLQARGHDAVHRVHFEVDHLPITFWRPEDLPAARDEVQQRLADVLREIRTAD